MKGTAICCVCKQPIKGGVFSPFVENDGTPCSACDNCATHEFGMNENNLLVIKEKNEKTKNSHRFSS